MAKNNYKAWHIRSEDFSEEWPAVEKLRLFARYAILAPSGHNTQPWRFTQDKQSLLLHADNSRSLPYSGVQANEPHVSLGCCLGVLELAAKGFGYSLAIDYHLSGDLVAAVRLSGKIAADPSLLEAITRRVSNRSLYDTAGLPDKLIQGFTKTTFKNVSTRTISKQSDISFIAEKTREATYRTFGDKEFRTELSKWVRNNITKQHDGMPGFVQGIPTPPSLFAKHIIKRLDVSKDQAKKDSSRILHSADLLLINVKDPGKEALLNAGRLYAQICVLAQQQGIASSGLGTAIVDPEAKKEIAESFRLDSQPIAIIRLGKTGRHARHTPRWPISKVSG